MDMRWIQIGILSTLLVYLQTTADFAASLVVVVAYILSGIIFQIAFSYFYRVKLSLLSTLISCVSLALLLRVNNPVLASLAAFIVVAGKFWIRVDQRHIFNPSNVAIVVMLVLFSNSVWLSPSQWSREVLFVFVISSAGLLLARKVGALHSALAFIISYLAGKFLYASYMGDPWTIPMLALSNGGLFLFTFYMVTDPMTAPNHWQGKWLYAMTVAAIANYLELFKFWPTGVFHALVIICAVVPLLNKIFVAERFLWDNKKLKKQGVER